jgi:hypothetical protein
MKEEMKMKTTKLIRLSKTRIDELKQSVKSNLSFKVRFQVNTAKYGKGTFNLLPAKSNGKKFTKDQALEIFNWMEENNLYTQSFLATHKNPSCYWQSVGYILGKINT